MTTKDERFLIELSSHIQGADETVDPYTIGENLGFTPHQIKTILRGLGQSNCIKKYSKNEIALTARGYEVVKALKGS